MLKDWRHIEGKTIAIDSFKVRAQNSLKNNYNLAIIHRHLDYIDAKIDAYCEELDQADDDEEKEQLQAKIANVTNQVIPVEDFKYHPGSDTYRCPNGSILRSNEMIYHRKSKKPKHPATRFKHYRTADCKLCPIRSQCTNARNGRIIQRNEPARLGHSGGFQSAIDRNNKRVLKNPDYYRRRQQIIEPARTTFSRAGINSEL